MLSKIQIRTFFFFAGMQFFLPGKVFSQEPTFTFLDGMVGKFATTPGYQMSADVGPDYRIHIISASDNNHFCGGVAGCKEQRGYYHYNEDGVTVLRDNFHGDGAFVYHEYNPAIAVDPNGFSHVVTRDSGMSYNLTTGRPIRYRRVNPFNEWDRDYIISPPKPGNQNVAVAAPDGDHIYAAFTDGSDVRLYSAGAETASELGVLAGVYQSNNRMVMKGKNGTVFIASGDDNQIHFSWANAGSSLINELSSHKTTIADGTGKMGMPDLYVNSQGMAFLCYGAENAVFFNRFDKTTHQKELATSVKIFDFSDGEGNLWSKKFGFGWLAASDDGKVIFAIGARVIAKGWSDYNTAPLPADFDPFIDPYIGYGAFGEQVSRYFFNYSTDGGQTWKGQTDLTALPYERQSAWIASGRRPTTINYIHGKFFFSHYDVSWYKEFSVGIADFSALMEIPDLGHDLTLCALPSSQLDSKVPANGTTTFTWLKNGVKVVDNSTTENKYTIDGEGLYKVLINGVENHAVNVFAKTPQPSPYIKIDAFKREGCCYPVGDNFVNMYAYDIPPERDDLHFTWYQDNVKLSGNDKNDLFIFEFGVFKVEVQETGCEPVYGVYQVAETECPAECPTVGINNGKLPLNNEVRILPNPVQDHFLIEGLQNITTDVHISVYNINNQLVLKRIQNVSMPVVLNESSMLSGMYFVRVYDGKKAYIQKFIKQ